MRFQIFQSEKGDCLLLRTDAGRNILVDGGMRRAYSQHVASALADLASSNEDLDLVYISHIDQDHISGVLQLLDDMAAWRVYAYQKANGLSPKQPKVGRPPPIKSIWHNSFHDQIGKNAGRVSDLLAASAAILSAAATKTLIELSEAQQELALSEAEALRVSQRIKANQLNIPLNQPYAGKLMMVTNPPASISLGNSMGNLQMFIIGPFEDDLATLRDKWIEWLRANSARVRELRRKAEQDARHMGNSIEAIFNSFELEAEEFGDRGSVTPPNLASLMLYMEEPGQGQQVKKFLFTGDGHWEDILKGLRHHRKLPNEQLHVDVLKVQHHGSEHNIHADFCRRITADNYLFCGNGQHDNPDLGVVKLVLDSRVGDPTVRSKNPEVATPFTLWFSSDQTTAPAGSAARHMRSVEDQVQQYAVRFPGKIKVVFSDKDFVEFAV